MNIITEKTKKSTYNLYIIVVTLSFILIFMDVVGKDSKFTKILPNMKSRITWLIINLATIAIMYLDIYLGVLIFIIILFVALKNENENENFVNHQSRPLPFSDIGNDSDKSKVIDNLLKSIKAQNPDIELDDNYINYLYDKYFNDDALLGKLTKEESSRIVSDLKSGFVISYDIEEDEKLKADRSRWHRLEKS